MPSIEERVGGVAVPLHYKYTLARASAPPSSCREREESGDPSLRLACKKHRHRRDTMKFCLKSLSFACEEAIPKAVSADNDIALEAAFSSQALACIAKARRLITAAGLPLAPPPGYFCEMLKSKEHMGKIAKVKADEKATLKASEDAKKQRINRKLGKKVQIEREQLKSEMKRAEKKKIEMIVKKRPSALARAAASFDDVDGDDFDVALEETFDDEASMRNKKASSAAKKGGRTTLSAKRQYHDQKFGHGGSKRGKKMNTRESAAEDAFDAHKNRMPFGQKASSFKSKGGARSGAQRPGKERRQQMRNKKTAFASRSKK